MWRDVRWSPGLEQREEDLDNTDDCRLALLLVKDVGQQLLHRLLPEGSEQRDEIRAGLKSFGEICLGQGFADKSHCWINILPPTVARSELETN